jgi:hypothetical protein
MEKALTGSCPCGAVTFPVEAPARARPFDIWPDEPMERLQAAREYRRRH